MRNIEPELREGYDEVELAKAGTLPASLLHKTYEVNFMRIRCQAMGSIRLRIWRERRKSEVMNYIGITDHSQSLKIAGESGSKTYGHQIRYSRQIKWQSACISDS